MKQFGKLIGGSALVIACLVPAGTAKAMYRVSACASGQMCATSGNISGYVNPSDEAGSYENTSNLANSGTYQSNNGIDNNVNSIRSRGNSGTYTGACFYWYANFGTPKAYVADTQPGWYNNSSTGLSSAAWVTAACM